MTTPRDEIRVTSKQTNVTKRNVVELRTHYGYECTRGGVLIASCQPKFASAEMASAMAEKAIAGFDRKLAGRAHSCSVHFDAMLADKAIGAPWIAESPNGRMVGYGYTPAQAFEQAKAKGWKLDGELPTDTRDAASIRAAVKARSIRIHNELPDAFGDTQRRLHEELRQIAELRTEGE